MNPVVELVETTNSPKFPNFQISKSLIPHPVSHIPDYLITTLLCQKPPAVCKVNT
jgi:hypothetical protein